jgi:hypothetical protein
VDALTGDVDSILDAIADEPGITPAILVLVAKLVAVCVAARPQPQSGAERTKKWRKNKEATGDDVTSHVTNALDRNINNSLSGVGGVGEGVRVTAASHGTRLPDDWKPTDTLWVWGREKLSEQDLKAETAAFKDYWHTKPGKQAKKLDWDLTWKVWIRNAVQRRHRFKHKDNVTEFKSSGPKRSWQEIKAEKNAQG